MTPVATRRMVTFGVGNAWYAADISAVERVLRHEGVHAVPGMPEWMEGVIDYGGRAVPVVALRRRLGLPAERGEGSGRLLLLSCNGDLLAATVDRVVDVRAVAEADLVPPPALVHGVTGEFLLGMMRRDDAMVFVLDVPRLFTLDERAAVRTSAALVAPAGFARDA